MINLFKIACVFLTVFCAISTLAQEKYVRGYVTVFDSIPLSGAIVNSKGTNQSVVTDSLGRFAIVSKIKDKLIVNANGFYRQKVKLPETALFAAVNLKFNTKEAKKRFISTGYGMVKIENKVSAITNIHSDDYNFSVYNNIYELIKGRIPGVQILNGEIIIRGLNSINSSSAATIIVDGITADQSTLNAISPEHVKNISVIKDGSAAIYGFKGSNGVLIIETKSGKGFHD